MTTRLAESHYITIHSSPLTFGPNGNPNPRSSSPCCRGSGMGAGAHDKRPLLILFILIIVIVVPPDQARDLRATPADGTRRPKPNTTKPHTVRKQHHRQTSRPWNPRRARPQKSSICCRMPSVCLRHKRLSQHETHAPRQHHVLGSPNCPCHLTISSEEIVPRPSTRDRDLHLWSTSRRDLDVEEINV